MRVSIVGGSGYVGGELARLVLGHPDLELAQVTSERLRGRPLSSVHPNLRGACPLTFSSIEDLTTCDVLFTALPHGQSANRHDHFAGLTERWIDCAADFRLESPGAYASYYGEEHVLPERLSAFVYGLPEATRERLRETRHASGVGCNATAINLALLPFVRAGVLSDAAIIADVKVGSSEGGASPSAASHHPERQGIVRSYAPTGHRHTAEVEMILGRSGVHLSVTSVELVRGALATVHAFLEDDCEDRTIRSMVHECYANEPFVRIVHDRGGFHRHPEPKLVAGTNFADVGWSYDRKAHRLVTLCAIDNLMKGAAGSAVQSLNVMCGIEETRGLEFLGLHPS